MKIVDCCMQTFSKVVAIVVIMLLLFLTVNYLHVVFVAVCKFYVKILNRLMLWCVIVP